MKTVYSILYTAIYCLMFIEIKKKSISSWTEIYLSVFWQLPSSSRGWLPTVVLVSCIGTTWNGSDDSSAMISVCVERPVCFLSVWILGKQKKLNEYSTTHYFENFSLWRQLSLLEHEQWRLFWQIRIVRGILFRFELHPRNGKKHTKTTNVILNHTHTKVQWTT